MSEVLNTYSWDENFPPVYANTSVSFLKRCRGFESAKKGNMEAALFIAGICVKQKCVTELKRKYPHSVLIPVISNNKLPEALAITIGLETYTKVYKVQSKSRKTLTAMERLLHEPIFSGDIIKEKSYIIVDDVVTQGGTVSALRRYILASGGHVSAVVSLACSTDSKIIAPKTQDILAVIDRFELSLINDVLKYYKIADNLHELTRSQLKYLLRFSNIDSLIDTINMIAKGQIT